MAEPVAARLTGGRGADFFSLAAATLRSVTRDIPGVALIRSLLAALGFPAVGIPVPGPITAGNRQIIANHQPT